ncbi:helix-turn-helix transcriptional regulator [uncultured Phascolarctobacterium sp.]|uniref:helix-turn-helix domain-containing protein n=1 Tax=uncultured Phascolarctobacterium sp. TaxID=512296 RepID=UPI0025CB8B27|nr:helix-turn-helix transcriptional regulator [uncultured Phascolarctobacterium sp.]
METNFLYFKTANNIQQDIAANAKKRRKAAQLTQKQLSAKSGVSLGSLKRFETTGEISLASLLKIAFALGCEKDFEELFKRRHYQSIQEIINGK